MTGITWHGCLLYLPLSCTHLMCIVHCYKDMHLKHCQCLRQANITCTCSNFARFLDCMYCERTLLLAFRLHDLHTIEYVLAGTMIHTLHYMLHSIRSGNPHSGANERLIGEFTACCLACTSLGKCTPAAVHLCCADVVPQPC
jgi:hypothetical protein